MTTWTIDEERRLRELVALRLWRRGNERLRYFQPNGGQEKFFGELFKPGAFVVVNASGNGGGKTYGLAAVIAAVCWPALAPSCLARAPLVPWKWPKRIRVISTPKEVEEIGSLQSTIAELFPSGRYEALKKGKAYPSQFKTDTGFVIDMMTYEQDRSEMAGPSIGLLVWNEPMPEDLWREGLARLRKGGLILVAMTSLRDNAWVVDNILGKADGKDIRAIYTDAEENCKEHGKNGSLEHSQIEKILSQYDPEEREARKTGRPLVISNRIFKTFDRMVHVSPGPLPPPESPHTIYQVVDPAIGKPLAAIWAWVGPEGVIHLYDEWPDFEFEGTRDSNLTVKDYAELFKGRESGKQVAWRILDRHFGNARRSPGGITLKQDFSDHGLDFTDSYAVAEGVPEVETGILRIKDFLRYDASKPIDSLNRPRLLISPHCRNAIASLERWSRNSETGRPREEHKDFADCIRYLVMSDPVHEQEKKWPAATGLRYRYS